MGSVVSEHNDPEGLHSGHKVSQVGLVTETEEIILNSKKNVCPYFTLPFLVICVFKC